MAGSFVNSAKNISIENDIITCELATVNNTYIVNKKKIQPNISYDNFNGVLTPSNYENSYFIVLHNQLGNCLRTAISGLIVAEHYHKHPLILFDNVHSEKEKVVISCLFRSYLVFHPVDFIHLNYEDSVDYQKFYGTNYDVICEGKMKNIDNYDKCGIINTIYSIIPENMSEELFIRKKIQLYQSLALPHELIKNVTQFMKSNDLNNCVGMHIRYSDNLNDTSKMIHQFNTPIDIFETKLNSLQQKILLCSDNASILKKFKSRENIIFPNKCSDKHFQGFYEMCLLAQCKSIIGSDSSTFSYEAAFIKGTDIELYVNNAWKKYEIEKYR